MSKTEICSKLKHMSVSKKIREQAITDLVNDNALIIGDWFSLKSIKGVTNFTGYLKGYPTDDLDSQIKFANMLAKYCIDFIDFDESFKLDKTSTLPRTLSITDIKQSTWLYSQHLMDTVLSNTFLKQRLQIDSSAVVHISNGEENFILLLKLNTLIFSLQVESKENKGIRTQTQHVSSSRRK